MGACAQAPGCRGQDQAPAGSSPAMPATTSSQGPCVPGSPAFQEQSLPPQHPAQGNVNEPQPRARAQAGPGLGVWGSHHSAPPVALDSEIGAEEQVGDGQEQGLSQGPGILIIVLSLLGTRHPWATSVVAHQGEVAPGLGGQEGTGSGQRDEGRGRRRKSK